MDLSGIIKVRYGEYDTPAEGGKAAAVATESRGSNVPIYDSIKAAAAVCDVLDDDTCFRLYIDSKLHKLSDEAAVEEFVRAKLKEYGLLKEPVAEEVKTEEVETEDVKTEPQRKSDDEIAAIEDELKSRGYDARVSRYKIKHVTPCIKVEMDGDVEGAKGVMESLGYTYKSKYKSSYYFVKE